MIIQGGRVPVLDRLHPLAYGVDYDVTGLSYYLFWHGALSALQANRLISWP